MTYKLTKIINKLRSAFVYSYIFVFRSRRQGQISLQLLILSTVTVILIGGFVMWAASFLNLSLREFNKTSAFAIAESGVEYYRWHLAHAPNDFQDGTGQAGPYTHTYYDVNGNAIGTFTLAITPPPLGSTVITIQSTGKVLADSSVQKTISVKLGIPSFAKYAWALNNFVVFGSAAQVFGPIHSNNLIHFDGVAHNLVTSAVATGTDPDVSLVEWGVYTANAPADPQPPTPVSNRPTIFMAGRQFPVPAIDFTGMTQNLAQIKIDALSAGFYRGSSTVFGYDVNLKTDDTFDLYRVTALTNPPSGCSKPAPPPPPAPDSQLGWGTWSISSSTLLGNYPFPANGLIFLEDNVWARGQINTARLTIASGRFPDDSATRSSITVNANLLYTNYDGQDVLSLIAQNNINVGLSSGDTERVDGALVAQNGRVGRYSYNSNCGSTRSRASFTNYGMLGSNLRPGFYYSSSNGYQARTYIYDANLLYGPPPSFPKVGDQYVQISWDEVQ